MRLRVILLMVATSSLVLVSFLVPLALLLRLLAADHAISTATAQAQSIAPLVTTLTTGELTTRELGMTRPSFAARPINSNACSTTC